MTKIPEFETLTEAVEFWETHDSADYWDDLTEVDIKFDIYKNLLHPRLTVLTHRPPRCPRCQHDFEDISIEYVVSIEGRLIIIRNVPAFRCQTNNHEYILEEIIDDIEHLLALEQQAHLQPTTTLQVPVFNFKPTV